MAEDAGEVPGPTVENYVTMAKKPSKCALPLSLAPVVMLKYTVRTYPRTLDAVGQKIGCLRLLELCRRFLYDAYNPHMPNQLEIPLHELPLITETSVRVFHSATAHFRAPSDPSGVGGMRCEVIRATPSWRNYGPRYDCVYLMVDPEALGFHALNVVRVQLLFSFRWSGKEYPCALVKWFSALGDQPDEVTGLWIVKPDINVDGNQDVQVVHLETIVRLAHLLPVFGNTPLPVQGIHPSDILDTFHMYYVNKYADHHSHTLAF
jgi:hypothetical protein